MSEFETDNFSQGGFQDTSLKPAPKKIIVCCDGTWQSSVTTKTNIPSNVTRLARYLTKVGKDADGTQWQQVVYYDAGIGTGVTDREAKIQGGTGTGFVGNVIEAYNFIVLNYNPGDKICCLGFSRGAYTARAVAGLVTDIGIIKPRDMQDFPELYQIYQKHSNSHLFRKSPAFREWVEGKRLFDPNQKNLPEGLRKSPYLWEKRPHGAAPESSRWVEAVGVFDTVGSLGIPKIPGLLGTVTSFFGRVVPVEEFGFHNVTLSPYIRHAFHALALDEHRKPFSPTLWHLPTRDPVAPKTKLSSRELREKFNQLRDDDSAKDSEITEVWENLVDAEMYEELKGHRSELLQVWFPGVHINIGGGSDDLLLFDDEGRPKANFDSDFEQIAMLTLFWMAEQLKPYLSFEISMSTLADSDRFLLMRPVVDKLVKDKKTSNWLIKSINASIQKDPKDPFNDNNQTRTKVFAADALKGWATGPIIDSFQGEMKLAGSLDRTPGGYKDNEPGSTNEQMHPTVQFRREYLGKEWKAIPLQSFSRNLAQGKDGKPRWEWSAKGGIVIPEYKIDPSSLERTRPTSEAARAFVAKLDKELGIS